MTCDLGGEASQKYRFFHGGIAAADHGDLLAREKEAIAGGARGNAVSNQLLLVRQPEPACRRAAGDDQCSSVNDSWTDVQFERALAEIDAGHVAVFIFGAKARRLLAHVLDQFRSLNALGKAGKVLHQRGERELSPGLVAFEHQRFQVGARGVERGGVSGTAGAHDDNVADVFHRLVDSDSLRSVASRGRRRYKQLRLRISDFGSDPELTS